MLNVKKEWRKPLLFCITQKKTTQPRSGGKGGFGGIQSGAGLVWCPEGKGMLISGRADLTGRGTLPRCAVWKWRGVGNVLLSNRSFETGMESYPLVFI